MFTLMISHRNSIFGMGIADGVYAMREQGIDSGIFSSTLMQKALEMVKRGYDDVVQGEALAALALTIRRMSKIQFLKLG